MLLKYFLLLVAILVYFECVQAGIFNVENDKKAVLLFKTYGCSRGATDVQIQQGRKCLQQVNNAFYVSILRSITTGNCKKFLSYNNRKDIIAFCRSLSNSNDQRSQKLMGCAARNFGSYPDPDKITMDATECKKVS